MRQKYERKRMKERLKQRLINQCHLYIYKTFYSFSRKTLPKTQRGENFYTFFNILRVWFNNIIILQGLYMLSTEQGRKHLGGNLRFGFMHGFNLQATQVFICPWNPTNQTYILDSFDHLSYGNIKKWAYWLDVCLHRYGD